MLPGGNFPRGGTWVFVAFFAVSPCFYSIYDYGHFGPERGGGGGGGKNFCKKPFDRVKVFFCPPPE